MIRVVLILFYISLFFVNSNRFLLVVFLITGICLFFFSRFDLSETIFAVFLLSLPLERGLRDWKFDIVKSGPDFWISGYQYYFYLSIKIILFVIILLLNLKNNKKFLKTKPKILVVILLFFVLISAISTLLSKDYIISFLGFTQLMLDVGCFYFGLFYFRNKEIGSFLIKLFTYFLGFFGVIGVCQMLFQNSIGLYLEEVYVSNYLKFVTTDSLSLFRVSGLMRHPTFFAAFLALAIPVGIGNFLDNFGCDERKGIKVFRLLSIFMGLLALIGTYSRIAYFSVFLSLLFIFSVFFYKLKFNLINKQTLLNIFLIFIFVVSLYSQNIVSRLRVTSIFGEESRINLMRRSMVMIKENPIFGVGINRFTTVLAQQDLTPNEQAFLYPVHNVFLLFFSEIGIVGGILFLIFMIWGMITTRPDSQSGYTYLGVWLGIFTYIINAQMHPLFGNDSTLAFVMLMMAYLLSKKWSKKV